MKRTKPTPSRTKAFQSALKTWDKASKAHDQDLKQRGKAMIDSKRLKLLLARRVAQMKLDALFHKIVSQ